MQRHEDGSITLSKDEIAELNHVYQQIMEFFTAMPFSIEDMIDGDDHQALLRWEAQLDGREYIPDDEEEDEEEYSA